MSERDAALDRLNFQDMRLTALGGANAELQAALAAETARVEAAQRVAAAKDQVGRGGAPRARAHACVFARARSRSLPAARAGPRWRAGYFCALGPCAGARAGPAGGWTLICFLNPLG